MGYYTTVTIDNAIVGNIINSPIEFTRKLVDACSGVYYKIGKDSFGLGVDEPFITIQKPKEFLETTVFVFNHGKLHEMNMDSSITRELIEREPKKYSNLVEILRTKVIELIGEESNDGEILNERKNIIVDTDVIVEENKTLLNSGESSVLKLSDEEVVSKWLKDNRIPTTVAKLKKLKTSKK